MERLRACVSLLEQAAHHHQLASFPWVDTHCHYHVEADHDAATPGPSRAGPRLLLALVMGTSPADWPAVEAFAEASWADPHFSDPPKTVPCFSDPSTAFPGTAAGPRCLPAFGLHPWYVASSVAVGAGLGWLEQLAACLTAHPEALVGEVGLDFSPSRLPGADAGPAAWATAKAQQREALRAQLALAHRFGRAASLHCVRAYGPLMDDLQALAAWPPVLLLHSYMGSSEWALMLLRQAAKRHCRVFFGVSARALRSSPRTAAALVHLPADCLLLESDSNSHKAALAELAALPLPWSSGGGGHHLPLDLAALANPLGMLKLLCKHACNS
jgi:Tat protein secretion system quality control protein TatD with DNase activity